VCRKVIVLSSDFLSSFAFARIAHTLQGWATWRRAGTGTGRFRATSGHFSRMKREAVGRGQRK